MMSSVIVEIHIILGLTENDFGQSSELISAVDGLSDTIEIIDLEKTKAQLEEVKKFVATLAKDGKQILFVSSKNEA